MRAYIGPTAHPAEVARARMCGLFRGGCAREPSPSARLCQFSKHRVGAARGPVARGSVAQKYLGYFHPSAPGYRDEQGVSDTVAAMSRQRKNRVAPKGWAGVLLASVSLWCGTGWAQGAPAPTAEDIAAARQLGAAGVTLAHEGRCAEAIDPLSRAAQLFYAPTILVELGYCRCEQGQLVEGTEALNRVARENLGANPPPAFVEAQTRARALLEKYSPKLAKLVITVQAPPGSQFQVAVDGKAVSSALLGVPRPSDPGERTVTVSGSGFKPAEAKVVLTEGGQGEVALVLEAAEATVVVPPQEQEVPVQAAPVKDTPPPTERQPNRVPVYVSYGVGAVGFVVGTVFGVSAMNMKSTLDGRCVESQCPEGSQGDIDALTRSANLATIGFALGVVGAGIGTYLLLTEEPGGDDVPSAASACKQGPCVRAVVGLGALGMEGVF
jgi:hypothetical protein